MDYKRSLAVGLGLLAVGGYLMKIGAPKNSPGLVIGSVLAIGSLMLAPALASLLGPFRGRDL